MAAYFRPGKASVIVGGQFGSEAKGLAAAHLALYDHQDGARIISTTNAGAQAGHTTIMPDGRKFVCYHLPTIGVLIPDSTIYLNAGSIIDPVAFEAEVAAVAAVVGQSEKDLWDRIVVHPRAAVIQPQHRAAEQSGSVRAIGSTQKGVGAALVSKIRREPDAVAGSHKSLLPCAVDALDLNHILGRDAMAVSVEIPQGTGLSLNAAPFFPTCTSRDCWTGQGLTDAGIHPSFLGSVAMVCRTFPIRVGHIYDDQGVAVGNSGPFYADSTELDWEDLPYVEPERTTVTKRVRRIATWSRDQYRDALALNRPDFVFLTFTNYLYETREGIEDRPLHVHAADMMLDEAYVGIRPAHIYSWGPRADQCNMSRSGAALQSVLAARRPVTAHEDAE